MNRSFGILYALTILCLVAFLPSLSAETRLPKPYLLQTLASSSNHTLASSQYQTASIPKQTGTTFSTPAIPTALADIDRIGIENARPATGFESPNFRELPYRIVKIDENRFCLTKELITSRIELRLLQGGITPHLEPLTKEYPLLEITVQLRDESYFIHLNLNRMSTFWIGNTPYEKKASMWNEEVLGLHQHDLDIIFDSLDYLLASFISQYVSANQ